MEISNPVRAAPATPPPPQPLGAIKEGAELEAEEGLQESQQDGVDNIMIPVTENLATEISNTKHCVNNRPGIEISECDNTSRTNPENASCNILEENSIPYRILILKLIILVSKKAKKKIWRRLNRMARVRVHIMFFHSQQTVLSRVSLLSGCL